MRNSLQYAHRSVSKKAFSAAALIAGWAACPSATRGDLWQIYEKFNYDPGWSSLNNRTSPQNFGYSLTNHTGGGDSQEAGGSIVREDNPRAYYGADIGSLSLNDPLKITGKLNAHTPGSGTIFLGFFNNGNGGYPQNNTLGLYLDGQSTFTNVYTRAVNGSGSDERSGVHTTLPTNTDLSYSLYYNPSGNSGNGQISMQINGGTTFTQNLPSGFKTSGATFNRFGLHNVGVDGSSFSAFMDDVTYTSSVPKVERFTVDPGWDGHNNRINNPREIVQNFGFSSGTSNAGGSTGEVGGSITPAGEAAYYAKSITSKTLNDSMTASGKVKVTGKGNTLLGFFYTGTVNEWRTQNSIALRLNGRGDGTFNAYTEYGTDLWRAGSTGDLQLNANQTYDWSLTYNPSGNGGNGSITGVIGNQTMNLNLDAGHKADEGVFNRFGLLNVVKSADDAGQVWIDNVAVNGGSTETFGSNPSWDTHNNSTTYNSNNVRFNFDFGHSATNFAGGQASGEIGGNFFRGDSREAGKMAFYGAELGQTLSLNDKLVASGKVAFRRGVSDSTVHLGFFNNTESVRVSEAQGISTPENFLGVTIEGPSSEGFFFYPSYNTDEEGEGSGGNRGDSPPRIYPDNDTHDWSLVYDPNGASGLGTITVTLDGDSGVMTLQEGHKEDIGALFNRFGFITPHIDGNGQTVFFDDLIWTNALAPTSTPEPATLTVLAVGAAVMLRRRNASAS